MESMIKRDVNISITAQVDLVRRLIEDALEVVEYRTNKTGRRDITGNAIYYRNMRQTGHDAANASLYTRPLKIECLATSTARDLEVLTVFSTRLMEKNFKEKIKARTSSSFTHTQSEIMDNSSLLSGRRIDVLVLSDYISLGNLDKGWAVAREVIMQRPEVRLVVFLG